MLFIYSNILDTNINNQRISRILRMLISAKSKNWRKLHSKFFLNK